MYTLLPRLSATYGLSPEEAVQYTPAQVLQYVKAKQELRQHELKQTAEFVAALINCCKSVDLKEPLTSDNFFRTEKAVQPAADIPDTGTYFSNVQKYISKN